MTSTVRIPWTRDSDNEYYWNEVCAWAIERFGLPGHKFQTHANVNYMDFSFKSNKDALMMALRWNGSIIDDNQITLDFVGGLMN